MGSKPGPNKRKATHGPEEKIKNDQTKNDDS